MEKKTCRKAGQEVILLVQLGMRSIDENVELMHIYDRKEL